MVSLGYLEKLEMEGMLKKIYLIVLLIVTYGCSPEMESQVDLVSAFDFDSGAQQ